MALGDALSITIPAVGTAFPTAAQNINDALAAIQTVLETQIGPSSFNINADLELNDNSLLEAQSVQFTNKTAALSASQTCRVYVQSNELYFSDGAGNQVQVTDGGTVGGSIAGITGDYPTDAGADVNFVASTNVYNFLQETNQYADVQVGSAVLYGTGAAAATAVTVSRPVSLPSSYTLLLPTALPGSSSVMLLDAAGQVSSALTLPTLTGLLTLGAGLVVSTVGITVTAGGISVVAGTTAVQALTATTVTASSTVQGTLLAHTASRFRVISAMAARSTLGSGGTVNWQFVGGVGAGPYMDHVAAAAVPLIVPVDFPSSTVINALTFCWGLVGAAAARTATLYRRDLTGGLGAVTSMGATTLSTGVGYHEDALTAVSFPFSTSGDSEYWIQFSAALAEADQFYGVYVDYNQGI
jgi:hypothetical protein